MKYNLATEIRKKVGLPLQSKTFFTKEEIETIVYFMKPKFKFDSVPYDSVLSTVVKGWTDQKTIERHPTVENMGAILKELDKKPYRLQQLTTMIDKSLLDQTKSIRLKGKVLTLTLK